MSDESDGPPVCMSIGDLLAEPKAREPAMLARVAPGFLVEETARGPSPGEPRQRSTRVVERVELGGDDPASSDPLKRLVYRLVSKGGDVVSVGRAGTVDVQIDSSSVSSMHARFFRTPKGWTIEDAGSRNGTFVDGERLALKERRALSPGIVVRFGPEARFTFFDPEGLATFLTGIGALAKASGLPQADDQVRLSSEALGGMALPSYLDDDDDDAPPVDDEE